ncbi:MAG: NUDIX hydrolase [Gammaproteobacteria bacterium]
MFSVIEIKDALDTRAHQPARFRADPSHASVAMITVPGDQELEVCFILRAQREGDPWSGQVAFPGGRAEFGDRDAYAVAERETGEEIGLSLDHSHRLGALPVRPEVRGSLTLSPFIYHLPASAKYEASPQDPTEVARVFWVPMSHLFDSRAVTDLEYPLGGSLSTFPGIGYDGEIIWGLTLRILNSFADMMGRSMPVAY